MKGFDMLRLEELAGTVQADLPIRYAPGEADVINTISLIRLSCDTQRWRTRLARLCRATPEVSETYQLAGGLYVKFGPDYAVFGLGCVHKGGVDEDAP